MMALRLVESCGIMMNHVESSISMIFVIFCMYLL